MSFFEKLLGKGSDSTTEHAAPQATGQETLQAAQAERDQLKQTLAERDKRIAELEEHLEQRVEARATKAVASLGLNPDEEASIPQSTGGGEPRGRERMRAAIRAQLQNKERRE